MIDLIGTFLGADKIGGWVRAGVSAGFAVLIAKWPVLSSIMDPATQTAFAAALSGVAVGLWSHYVKS